jgi:hypothetical protein
MAVETSVGNGNSGRAFDRLPTLWIDTGRFSDKGIA